MLKYLGSKRRFVDAILTIVRGAVPEARTAFDVFSGSGRVAHALRSAGMRVIANDHNSYAATVARCTVEADATLQPAVDRLIAELAQLPGKPGWFTQTYCEEARFFQPKNGARIDAMRDQIAAWALPPTLEAVLLVALMEAADRVDSTVGVHMAYLKTWAPRATKDLALRAPVLLPASIHGPSRALQLDAVEAVKAVAQDEVVDVAYLDPPYNQHSYLANYHVWESLVLWDKPEVYGKARKRVDCRTRKSAFNTRARAHQALADVIAATRARALVVSFNNEGFISRDALVGMLESRGRVTVVEQESRRYVGARIGIFNPSGDKVGSISHLTNRELLFVVNTTS